MLGSRWLPRFIHNATVHRYGTHTRGNIMNKIERVMAVVEGRRPDRPPVSFWYHFDPGCHARIIFQ